ncbi:E3 ubiquitin-protein ligase rfwd3.S-like [Apostichopus japonicus]|uniref:E3 ubiquitin-protein ligase rfwd3.S-like n=1 Tax=Stichopus japonicus TaxID=307972 RepID=UPI003AB8F66A
MDSEAETVFDGDEGRSTPSSSQSTDLFDDDNDEEDDDRVMEVSDESGSRPDDTATWSRDSNSQHLLQHIVARTQNVISQNIHSEENRVTAGETEDNPGQSEPVEVNVLRTSQSRADHQNRASASNSQTEIQNSPPRPSSQSAERIRAESPVFHSSPVGRSSQSARTNRAVSPVFHSSPVGRSSQTNVQRTARVPVESPRSNAISQSHQRQTVPSITLEGDRLTASENERRRDSLSDFKLPNDDTKKTVFDDDTDSDDESQTCIICYEPWSNSGKHRLASLKCGHLFGSSCIQKWLKGQGGKCPHCNAKAKKTDIRVIYAKALKAIDTSERDKAIKDLEKEKELRRKIEIEKAQIMLKYQMAVEEVNRMRSQVKHQSSSSNSSQPGPSSTQGVKPTLSGSYNLEKTISVSNDGNSRILSYDYSNHCLVASVPSPNQLLFAGFGVKKISALMNWKTNQYLPMHSKPIRGMAFNGRNDGLLLTGAMDKTLKITSLTSSTVVQVYDTAAPVWSCCWNQEDVNYLYAGLSNGTILVYDTRNTSQEVLALNREGSKHPIVAMNYVPKSEGSRFNCSGLLVGTLSNCSFWEQTLSLEFTPHILPLEGNCISLSFEGSTRHCLASFRPNKTYPSMRHVMCELLSTTRPGDTEPEFKCNPIQSYFGGSTVKLLARSTIFRRPNSNDRLLIAAGDEGSSSLDLWDSNSGAKVQHLMVGATVLDICPFRYNNCDYLGALSEKIIKLYKWQP